MKRVVIFAGGVMGDPLWHKAQLAPDDYIIACDSGACHVDALRLIPHRLIGDFDSIPSEILDRYRAMAQVEVRHDPDQNTNDLQKALNSVLADHAGEVLILGALGGRMDHQLANMIVLGRYPNPSRLVLADETQEVRLLDRDFTFRGRPGQTVGILPLNDISTLRYEGLEYAAEVLGPPYRMGWLGTSNRMIGTEATVFIDGGQTLWILVR